jgi:predicted transposase/invertase (TIGR01784 family)
MEDWNPMVFTSEMEKEFLEAERRGLLPNEIDRFGDHFLKFLLAAPERKPLLLDLLNAILILMGYDPLLDIEPMDRELSPRVKYGRGLRLDYYGKSLSGQFLNMEFQKYGGADFIKRALFCSSAIIYGQLLSGDNFDALRQTIFIGLLDFNLFKWKNWYGDFVLSNVKTGKILTKDLLLIFVELQKLGQVLPELREKMKRGELDNSDVATRLALWGGYINGMGVDMMTEVAVKDEVFAQVLEAEQDFWGDSRNRFMQLREEKYERDALSQLRSAERRGIARGKREGKREGKMEIVRALLGENVSIEVIRKATGFSEDEIASLLSQR